MRLRLVVPVSLAITLATAGLAACGSTGRPAAHRATPTSRLPAPRQSDRVLILANRVGAVSVGVSTGEVVFRAPDGVASPDSSTIVQAQPLDSGTRVVASDSRTGVARWSHDVAGTRRVRVVAPGGKYVALVDGSLTVPSTPRSTTTIAIATAAGIRTVRLEGNLDPEAFSVDGRYLYTLDFLPAMNPTRYSVRRIDLRTNRIQPVPDRDGGVREPMPGYARTQLMSPDGTQLYTFYASQEPVHEDGETYNAWVHVLNLAEGWAHCVDLDERIGAQGNANAALAVTPDGSRLFVTDGMTHAVAAVDTETLRVVRTRFPSILANANDVSLLATHGRTLFARSGYGGIATIDAETLAPKQLGFRAAGMSSLRIDGSGQVLYLLTQEELLVIDARGRIVRQWPNPGDATSVDPSVTVPGSGAYQCAC